MTTGTNPLAPATACSAASGPMATIRSGCARVNSAATMKGPRGSYLHSEGRSSGFEGVQPILRIGRHRWVEQDGDPGNPGRDLLEQLQPLAAQRPLHHDETSRVTAGPREARDEAAADRIGNNRENDGDNARFLQ